LNDTPSRVLMMINGENATTASSGDNTFPATEFGVYQNRTLEGLTRAGRTSLGSGSGVHIDDIVIGLAERGEAVSSSVDTSTQNQFANNPYSGANGVTEIADGAYQLEVRTSRETLLEANFNTGYHTFNN